MALTGIIGLLIYKWLKHALVRERPFIRHPGITLAMPPLDRYSFPSGHTLHAVSFTWQAVANFPELAWVLIPLAGLIAALARRAGAALSERCAGRRRDRRGAAHCSAQISLVSVRRRRRYASACASCSSPTSTFPRVNGVSTSIRTFRADLRSGRCRHVLVAPSYGERAGAHGASLRCGQDEPGVLRVAAATCRAIRRTGACAGAHCAAALSAARGAALRSGAHPHALRRALCRRTLRASREASR